MNMLNGDRPLVAPRVAEACRALAGLTGASYFRLFWTEGVPHPPEFTAEVDSPQGPANRCPQCFFTCREKSCLLFSPVLKEPLANILLEEGVPAEDPSRRLLCLTQQLAQGIVVGLQVQAGETPRAENGGGEERLLPLQYLLELVAGHLQSSVLLEEIRQSKEREEALLRSVIEALEAERESLSYEVHDRIAQPLVSALHYMEGMEGAGSREGGVRPAFQRVGALLRQSLQECRDIIRDFQPAILQDTGLQAALLHELWQVERECGCKGELQFAVQHLPWSVEVSLYRVLREALINVRRHARSPRVRVQVAQEPDCVRAEVQDWGVGFAPGVPGNQRRVSGLTIMRRRVEFLGGLCEISSQLGFGTVVSTCIPLSGLGEGEGRFE